MLADGFSPRGTHEAFWDGTDDAGNPVPSGVYICRLRTESGTSLQKMLLLR
jgi:flagellar hook assembly protein FlgD